MKAYILALLFVLSQLGAQESDRLQDRNMQFNEGYTIARIFDYHIKITAEQRIGDKMVQVIVFPDQQSVHFHITNVEFGIVHPNNTLTGPVAKVHGVVTFIQSNIGGRKRMRTMIPVQIATVSEFTVSRQEAQVEGNECFERRLSKLLSRE